MPLDPKAIDELRALDPDGTTGIVTQVIESYLHDTAVIVGKLRTAIAGADIVTMTREAHSLKSTSRSVGATRLSELAAAIERAGRAGHADGCAAALAELVEEYKTAEPALRDACVPPQG